MPNRAIRGATPLIVILLSGCATTPFDPATTFTRQVSMAWSLQSLQDEMVVKISPARQTLRFAGTTGLVIGAGIDAVANSKHREAIREALGDYDAEGVFEARLRAGLEGAVPGRIERVAPLGSTGGFKNRAEAEAARLGRLAEAGADFLLDIETTYGLFGYEGVLVVRLEGDLYRVADGKRLWRNALVVSTEPVLADARLSDPAKSGLIPSSLRLTAAEDAVAQWTVDGGAALRSRFERAVDGAVSALLCDLGLTQAPLGEYFLGKLAMYRKQLDAADVHFSKATELDPHFPEARNARAVNQAYQGNLDEAIAAAIAVTESDPHYPAAWWNLGWWSAEHRKDPAAARIYFERAAALGMPAPQGK